jgi:DNA polymerase III subunit epsilon
MVNDHSSDLLIIDFEASGLRPGSWPIELGMGWRKDDGTWAIESKLIRPHPSWSMNLWDADAEAVHGISRDELEGAPTPEEVAEWYLDMAKGRQVTSDFPDLDGLWARRLVKTGVIPDPDWPDPDVPWASSFFHNEVPRSFSEAAVDAMWGGEGELSLDYPKAHRAAADVRRLTDLWDALIRFDQQRDGHAPQP